MNQEMKNRLLRLNPERKAERAADPKPWKVVQYDSIENIETVVSCHASERAAMRSVRAEISRQNLHNRKYASFLNYSIRADAPTIIVAAAHDAAPGSEGIFNALVGLRTEEKIVALVNALHAAGVTIHRVEEDGFPIIRASMPDYHPEFGTCTVLNL